jgi:RNA polymerase sigma-70 factor, ECF subfamily
VSAASTNRAADTTIDAVVRAHGDALERVAWGYVENAADRDDLMQEILMALWRALPRFRGESSLRTFVLRVAHNRAITFSARRRGRLFEDLQKEEVLRDPAPLAEERLIDEQQRDRLFGAIRRLPEAQRQAVMLQLEGLSQREIAELQDTSEDNVGVRLTRARKALRGLLMKENE